MKIRLFIPHVRWIFIVLTFVLINSCESTFVEDDIITTEDPTLKSATVSKAGYIVVLNDETLNLELGIALSYEKKNEKVKDLAAKILTRAGITDGEIELIYSTALTGFSVKIPSGQLKKLEADASVKFVEADKVVTLIEPAKTLGISDASISAVQTVPWGISRVNGGADYTGSHVAWIIDTGVDLDHPDLNVDVTKGASFVSRVPSPNDDNGHGSHVAGTIAAIDNGQGVVGVAAGATVIPVKVLDKRGSGYWSWIIAGVDYVAANGNDGDVANMSLGGSYSLSVNTAVINAAKNGIKFALAAGNESTDAGTKSPASAEGANIFTISAMDIYDNFASFSNFNNPPVDFCAPGVSIYSTYKDAGYATMSGTSMASPHVAGILLWQPIPENGGLVNGDPDDHPDPIAVVTSSGDPINNPPIAGFNYSVTDLTANFTDTSTDTDGTITNWSWSFGDGESSIATNPTHTYSASGTYLVTLTVMDNEGASGSVSNNVTVTAVIINNPPVANFTYTANDLTVNFSDASTDSDGSISSWIWNFGDGENSTYQNPTHAFASAGTYSVSLLVTDNVGDTDETSKNVTVTVITPSTISLSVDGYKVKGVRFADLTWSGAEGTSVKIYRNGTLIATENNDGSYTDDLGRLSGTFIYRVCEADGTICSNEVSVIF